MIIIKYYEWLRLIKDAERYPIWEKGKIVDGQYIKVKELTKEEAKRLIRENHFRLVHFNNDGAIYR